jgi:hypothetical protein
MNEISYDERTLLLSVKYLKNLSFKNSYQDHMIISFETLYLCYLIFALSFQTVGTPVTFIPCFHDQEHIQTTYIC